MYPEFKVRPASFNRVGEKISSKGALKTKMRALASSPSSSFRLPDRHAVVFDISESHSPSTPLPGRLDATTNATSISQLAAAAAMLKAQDELLQACDFDLIRAADVLRAQKTVQS
jgi:hypothetical protein